MSKKKRKQHVEEHIDETWLIPYSDLLTLLLALFIVLFAMSEVDSIKFKQMAEAFSSSFTGGTGVMKYPSPLPERQLQSLNAKDAKNKQNQQAQIEEQEMQQIKKNMDNYIESKDLNVQLETSLSSEGLMLTIRNDILFDSGTAQVRPQDYQIAREISQLLVMDHPREVIISGHTDNVPIHNAQFDSNWHLSVMRAVNFMKILLENNNLDAKWFSAKGYGEFRPVASNNTPEGRLANRRVEILIKSPDQADTPTEEVQN
ncbi:MAG TPA: flagellar motor protein MotB [Bacillus bacterium]|nr:flagellar motor protein MotB [Bacillus sp. (in: firmicutes)]